MSNLYMEIEGRRAVILEYAQRYDCRTFVETGTADGSTTAAMVPHFDQLYTIEIDEGLWTNATYQFFVEPKVTCMLGDSAEQLPYLMPKLTGPTVFWLDGHYCGGATRGSLDSPVESELKTVLTFAPIGSVVLVDDARLFGGGPAAGGDNGENYTGYPDLGWVHMEANVSGYHYLLQDDIIRLTSREI